jgi:threonylcarbamoyladenosine tRNA methylthiotransferase MtaB
VSRFHVQNFGCRATQADGASLERQFEQLGLSRAPSDLADFIVLNTCTVTAAADQDARAAIRRIRRQNPVAKVIVTGCYAQRAPGEVAALPGVSAVIGNSHKHRLAEIALADGQFGPRDPGAAESLSFVPLSALIRDRIPGDESITGTAVFVSDIFAHTELLAAPVFESSSFAAERTRPNLKVQDGCDNRCSFCVIPSVRGHSRSLSLDRILEEVRALVSAGYHELVLSGINLGRWGRDLDGGPQDPSRALPSLIRAILAETSLQKLRISSVEPMDWSDELISLVASSSRIAKHAHVPLQSGSDTVLRRMHRKYRPWHYRGKIEKIHAAMPIAAIGADVMVGFPGETDAELEQTRRLIEDLPFTYLHVFTYSARPGTPAASMPNQVPASVARERSRTLRELSAAKHAAFLHSFVGKNLDAITLGKTRSETDGESTEALTDNFLKLSLRGMHAPNCWISARIESSSHASLAGTITEAVRRPIEAVEAPFAG